MQDSRYVHILCAFWMGGGGPAATQIHLTVSLARCASASATTMSNVALNTQTLAISSVRARLASTDHCRMVSDSGGRCDILLNILPLRGHAPYALCQLLLNTPCFSCSWNTAQLGLSCARKFMGYTKTPPCIGCALDPSISMLMTGHEGLGVHQKCDCVPSGTS
jgi:hypothetical protein